MAVIRYVQNRAGSLSFLSSDSQAIGCLQLAAHSASSVLLPKPAGAETRVSLRVKLPSGPIIPVSILSMSRGR